MAASIPKVPLPESMNGVPSVPKSFFCRSKASTKPSTNSPLTWLSTGFASTRRTRGETMVGPGIINNSRSLLKQYTTPNSPPS